MLPLIAILFIAIPIIEIVVLIEVGSVIGAWNTVALIILTAVGGTALLRIQGLATMARVRESLARDTFPAAALFDAACVLVAGALLLLPGFVTDLVGLLLFLPPVRKLVRWLIWRHLARHGKARVWVNGEEVSPGGGRGGAGGSTIEGEWQEVDPRHGEAPRDRIGRRDEEDDDGAGGPSRWGRR